MNEPKLALTVLLCSLFVFQFGMAAQNEPAEHKTGSICVLPNSPERPMRISPGGEYNPDTLTIRIDNLKSIPWPHKRPVVIDDLDLKERHLVVLTSDGKRIQSFRFNFSEMMIRDCAFTSMAIRECSSETRGTPIGAG